MCVDLNIRTVGVAVMQMTLGYMISGQYGIWSLPVKVNLRVLHGISGCLGESVRLSLFPR